MGTIKVVGAGFSGLITAYYLVKAGCKVRIVDSACRAGGMLKTIRTDHGLVETAANGIRNSARLEALCAEIGVPLQATRREARERFIYRNRPRRWPLDFSEMFQLVLRTATNVGNLRPQSFESIAAWGKRVLGAGATDYFLSPALGGIYAGDPQALSASLIFRRARLPHELRAAPPDRPKPKLRGTVAPPAGMQQLIDGLSTYLGQAGVEFSFNQAARAQPGEAAAICTSAQGAAEYLSDIAPELSRQLGKIEMLPLVTATCFYSVQPKNLRGFGCLFPRDQGFRALGVLFNSFIFEGRGPKHSETWILGGALDREVLQLDDDALQQWIAAERQHLYGRHDEALATHITRWPTALPHYSIQLERILTTLPSLPPQIGLVGNYLGRIGLTGIIERAAGVAGSFRNKV
ncbi:MAG TPA: FAD-dependent oxidoreductase [Pyrinomonadaceae bacterium]|nr:FAD-dependent oxidoreductase [Pyrinomonadaceae bacterium]